jgi:hypothetical protein
MSEKAKQTKATPKVVNEKLNEVKKEVKKKVVENHSITEEEQKVYNQALKEALMPVTIGDADFKLGANELDIRQLSKSNKEQIDFRQAVLNVVYLRQLNSSLVDITRLLMIVLKKLGVEDVIGATDDLIEELKEKTKKGLEEQQKVEA